MPNSYLYIGLSAMRAFRLAMDSAGQNVANVNTPGYSRRRVNLNAVRDISIDGLTNPQGVEVSSLKRVREPFLDFALRRESSRLGADDTRSEILSSVESLFGEIDKNPLQSSLTRLFNSFDGAAALNQESARQEIVASAQEFTGRVRSLESSLRGMRFAQDESVRATVGRINDISAELSSLNQEIAVQEVQEFEASSLRDRRDLLVDELTSLTGVRAVEGNNGTVSVFLEPSGDELVSGSSFSELTLSPDSEGVQQVFTSRAGTPVNLTAQLRSGKLGGTLSVRDDLIEGYRADLDRFAQTVVTEMNAIHSSGFDQAGNPGQALFVPDPPGPGTAATIELNASIATDPDLLALSSVAGEFGNIDNAVALHDLRDARPAALGDSTFVGFIANLISDVGRDRTTANIDRDSSQVIVDNLEQRRQSAYGVSLDEEAANLIVFQQAFQASAQFMQTVNRVSELAFSLLGR